MRQIHMVQVEMLCGWEGLQLGLLVQMLWLVHTAWDLEWEWERDCDRVRWVYILYIPVHCTHYTNTKGPRTNGLHVYFPIPGPGTVQCI